MKNKQKPFQKYYFRVMIYDFESNCNEKNLKKIVRTAYGTNPYEARKLILLELHSENKFVKRIW